jgi:hypothetical protein
MYSFVLQICCGNGLVETAPVWQHSRARRTRVESRTQHNADCLLNRAAHLRKDCIGIGANHLDDTDYDHENDR